MKKTLYDLWYSYQSHIAQDTEQQTEESILLLKEQARLEKQFLEMLSEEQKSLFYIYEDAVNAVSSASEREAFSRGVHFATSFLIEAFCQQ